MDKVRKISKIIILLALIGCMVISTVCLIMPKFYVQTTEWISTSSTKGFYDLDPNSADVIFLGSSHTFSSFSPQELYNEFNITSYNLGTGLQSPLVSYYWLKEALRYQTPKVVVLEMLMFWSERGRPIIADEPKVRNALDPMRWSSVKIEAVNDMCRLDPSQSKLSYYLTNIRFHERWKDLNEDDFSESDLRKHNELKGFSPLLSNCNVKDYQTLTVKPEEGATDFTPSGQEYLDKITELCNDNNISLILAITPYKYYTSGEHNAVQQYADKHNLQFINFNEEGLYNELNYDLAVDNHDDIHPNLSGSIKITDYLGRVLTEKYGLVGHADEQWERTKQAYDDICKDFAIKRENGFAQYLKMMNDPRYTVFISAKGEWTESLTQEQLQGLNELGLKTEFEDSGQESFYAVIQDGKVVSEKTSHDQIEEYGSFRGGKSHYYIMSAGPDAGSSSSMTLDEKECSLNRRGLNIVVYNTARRQILDSVNFDTYEGSDASR